MATGSVTSATTMSAESPGLLIRATGSSASNGSVTAYQSCAVTVALISKHALKRRKRNSTARIAINGKHTQSKELNLTARLFKSIFNARSSGYDAHLKGWAIIYIIFIRVSLNYRKFS